MNNIKVTVDYEQPKTNVFDELMEQYRAVEKKSLETIEHYKPLADVAETTKLNLILEQLETIKNYLLQLNKLNPHITSIITYIRDEKEHKSVEFRVKLYNGEVTYLWDDYLFSEDAYKKYPWMFNNDRCAYLNILGNWDKWNVYTCLEKEAISKLKYEMKTRKNEAEKEINRLNNIVGG